MEYDRAKGVEVIRTFIPKRGIGPACDEARRRTRARRIAEIRVRHFDRLGEIRHARMDNALWTAANAKLTLRSEAERNGGSVHDWFGHV